MKPGARWRKLLGHMFVLAWWGVAPLGVLKADVYTVSRQGGAIVPVVSTDVSMDAETVVIEPGEYDLAATATFWMRNQATHPVESTVAFPVTGSHSTYRWTLDVNRDFKVYLKDGSRPDAEFVPVVARLQVNAKDGTSAAAREVRALEEKFDFAECVVWEVKWAPGETKIIRVSYEVGSRELIAGSTITAGCTQLLYIVRTGALWKGPIGRADITFRGLEPLRETKIVSYPQQARWNGAAELSWHFENWTPTEDLWLKEPYFAPHAMEMPGYYFLLPTPYAGDQAEYAVAMIEDLAERELAFAKEYFPKEAAAVDRTPVRREIADWLYHELFARNGDPFFIGKQVEGQPAPEEARGYTVHDGNYIGRWRERFNGFGGRKGWYRPKPDVDGKPPVIELSPLERKNAEFLKSYMEKLRG